jgi:hypothetical protein
MLPSARARSLGQTEDRRSHQQDYRQPDPFLTGGNPRAAFPIEKWCDMLEAEVDARRLGHRMHQALVALITFWHQAGCYPAHATVAQAARVSVNTVVEAERRAAAMGYMAIAPQPRQLVTINGRRVPHQQPSRRTFLLPASAVPSREFGLAWRAAWWARHKARRAARQVPDTRVCREQGTSKSLSLMPTAVAAGGRQEARQKAEAGPSRLEALAALAAIRERRMQAVASTRGFPR